MQASDLNHRIYDLPFKPFRIHLSDGSSIPVIHAGMLLVGESTAIVPIKLGQDAGGFPVVRRWRTVVFSHMVQFSDLDEPVSGKRPKKRG